MSASGADWDGDGGIAGLQDIRAHRLITARLKQAGNSDTDIEKMWSGKVVRIIEAAERAAR